MSERRAQEPVPTPAAEGSLETTLARLRAHTPARIALQRHGVSLGTADALAFDLAHAQARDAVHTPLDGVALREALAADGWPVVAVRSQAPDRPAYLARPDWGRRLHADDVPPLAACRTEPPAALAVVIADGLSSTAVQRHGVTMLRALREVLPSSLALAPIVIATQARVALGDAIGETLGAAVALMLIGERPGLSSPDSLGAYLTYAPRVGRSDAERNCISNIRPAGLSFASAAAQVVALIEAMRQSRLSGVALRFDASKGLPQDSGATDAP